ncbi:MAG: hypothetical protein AB7V00_02530 [Bacilli bacterium]
MLTQYQSITTGISSIGLDGEKIDQITFLPKPRIFTSTNTIVATAKNCLDECEAQYDIIEETKIVTALGPIVLIKITKAGNCLVGGPSTIQSMRMIIDKLKEYECQKILIDGAFSRTTLAQICDATIFCVGSSFSYQLDKIVLHTLNTIKLFNLPKYNGTLDLKEWDDIVLIDDQNKMSFLKRTTTLDCGADIISQIKQNIRYVYVPKAVSPSFLKALIDNRQNLNCDLIVNSPTHLLADDILLKHLLLLKQKIFVLQPINLVALTFNPFSPTGNVISLANFRNKIEDRITLPIYDVLEKSN